MKGRSKWVSIPVLVMSAFLLVYWWDQPVTVVSGLSDYNDTAVIDERVRRFKGDKGAIEGYLRRSLRDWRFSPSYRGYLLAKGTRHGVAAPWVEQSLMEGLQVDGSELFLMSYLDSLAEEKVYPSHTLLSVLKAGVGQRSKSGQRLDTKRIASLLLLEERSLLEIIDGRMDSFLQSKGGSSSERRLLVGILSMLMLRSESPERGGESRFLEFCSSHPAPLVRQMVVFLMKEGAGR